MAQQPFSETIELKDKREMLEQTALDLVQRHGLSGVSFRTLADEVGIKSSSVHYHFPDKSDLTNVLIERYSDCLLYTSPSPRDS